MEKDQEWWKTPKVELHAEVPNSVTDKKYVMISKGLLKDFISRDISSGNFNFTNAILDTFGRDVKQIARPTVWLQATPDPYLYFQSSNIDRMCKSGGGHYITTTTKEDGTVKIKELTPA